MREDKNDFFKTEEKCWKRNFEVKLFYLNFYLQFYSVEIREKYAFKKMHLVQKNVHLVPNIR